MKSVEIVIRAFGLNEWEARLNYEGKEKVLKGIYDYATPYERELYAIISALNTLKEPCALNIHSKNETIVKVGSGVYKSKRYKEKTNIMFKLLQPHVVEWTQDLKYEKVVDDAVKKLREDNGVFLSEEALKLQNMLIEKYGSFPPAEDGVRFNREWTLIPKDFCLVCMSLNLYQDYLKEQGKLPIPDDVVDWLMDFAQFQEYLLCLHDGREK